MTERYLTKGIVLRSDDLFESDKRFTLFTEEYGLLDVVGKSIRKGTSKMSGHLSLFSLVSIEFIQGKRGRILVYAQEERARPEIMSDLKKKRACYRVSDTVTRLIGIQDRDDEVWGMLQLVLEDISGVDSLSETYVAYLKFFWRLVSHLGYMPQLDGCVECGKSEIALFCKEGVICKRCKVEDSIKVNTGVLNILKELSSGRLENMRQNKIGEVDKIVELIQRGV